MIYVVIFTGCTFSFYIGVCCGSKGLTKASQEIENLKKIIASQDEVILKASELLELFFKEPKQKEVKNVTKQSSSTTKIR